MDVKNAALMVIVISACAAGCHTTSNNAGLAGADRGESVAPGINDAYADVHDVGEWVERFEREGREVYTHREAIARLVTTRTDATLADIGAGTGLFTMIFARDLDEGRVVAVDIVPKFLEHIRDLADKADHDNVDTLLCTEDSTELPAGTIDVAFICDTYHHFEFPSATMRSLHAALRPGGEVVVVDFQRIPGQSSDWILDHVRADRETVIEEITSFGFELVEDLTDEIGLEQNYMLRFRAVSDD